MIIKKFKKGEKRYGNLDFILFLEVAKLLENVDSANCVSEYMIDLPQ